MTTAAAHRLQVPAVPGRTTPPTSDPFPGYRIAGIQTAHCCTDNSSGRESAKSKIPAQYPCQVHIQISDDITCPLENANAT